MRDVTALISCILIACDAELHAGRHHHFVRVDGVSTQVVHPVNEYYWHVRSARYHVFAGVTALWLASCVAGIVLIEVGRTCPVQQLRWWWSVLIISVPDTFLAAFECCRVACCFAQAPGRSVERAASRRCAVWLRSDVDTGAQTLRCRLQVFLVLSAGPP